MGYKIVITDDDSLNLKVANRILTKSGYETECLYSGEELLSYMEDMTPDLILLDIHMAGMDGFETLKRLHTRGSSDSVPVIFLTADMDEDTEAKALSLGAMDFVTKPFVESILLLRVRNTIELFRLQRNLMEEVRCKTDEVIQEHERNERLSMQVVHAIAGAVDAKDKYTNGHSLRVAQYSRELARRAGYSKRAQDDIYMMGLLHDVGKIGIGDAIIKKPSRLTDEEYDIIKRHPMVGYGILRNIAELPKLAIGARWHHERYDGTGYPDGLKGSEIPEEARLIAVADAYDAMTSCRTYHDSFDQSFVRQELINGRGIQFDPRFTDIMIGMVDEDFGREIRERARVMNENTFNLSDIIGSDKSEDFLTVLKTGDIDTKKGMKFCMNDLDFYAEMLDEFISSASNRAEKLNSSFEVLDISKYQINVHSLKSAARTVGADALSNEAEELEAAAKANDAETIKKLHRELISDLTKTTSLIRAALVLKGKDD